MQNNPLHCKRICYNGFQQHNYLQSNCLIFNQIGEKTMTKTEFAALCLKFQIDPYVALENENLVEALQSRDDRKAIEILANEF